MDQEIAERFENVLNKGNALLAQHVISSRGSPDRVDSQLCFEWQSQSLTLLQAVFGSGHVYVTNFEAGTMYKGLPQTEVSTVKRGMGVLASAEEDLTKGWTLQFSEMLRAEVFDDFLEMADHLLNEGGFKDAAAVLAGGTLEEHLRKLSQKNSLPIGKVSVMNDALRKQGVYTQITWSSVQTWYGLRNDAAHANYANYTHQQVAQMIAGVRVFIGQYPA